jgi:hypothetical protein
MSGLDRSLGVARLVGWSATAVTVVLASAGVVQAQPDPMPDAVWVRGTSTLIGQLDPGTTVLDGGVLRTRGAVLVTLEASSDERAAGRGLIRLDVDVYPAPDGTSVGGQVRYGTMRIENDAGAWEGRFAGRLSGAGFSQTYWLEGEAAYEGLTYVVTAGGDGDVWTTDGLIYRGEPPPLSDGVRLPVEAPDRDLPAA